MPIYVYIAGAAITAFFTVPRVIQSYRRRRFPPTQWHRVAYARHVINQRGAAMWHEQEKKAERGVN